MKIVPRGNVRGTEVAYTWKKMYVKYILQTANKRVLLYIDFVVTLCDGDFITMRVVLLKYAIESMYDWCELRY